MMEFLFVIFIGLVLSAIPVSVFGSLSKAFGEGNAASGDPLDTREAAVAAKRMQIVGGDHAATLYFVTFEFADGSRRELRLGGRAFGTLAEGDRGVLTTKGGRFIGFKRISSGFGARGASDAGHKCEACGAPYTGAACPYCGTPWRN